jgi:hypothetical protein
VMKTRPATIRNMLSTRPVHGERDVSKIDIDSSSLCVRVLA